MRATSTCCIWSASVLLSETRNTDRSAVNWGIAAFALITALRLLSLVFTRVELFVDEAQYWLWGQSLDFGYYSKPPLIAWVIRGVTDLAGSDAPFWIRAPGPVLHAVTGGLIWAIAARFARPWPAMLTGLAYLTMPGIAVGSLLFSTDTVMLPFFALSLGLFLRLSGRASWPLAALMGFSLGLGMMGKYAAVYLLLGVGLSALLVPKARISGRDALVALGALLIAISPNLWWNAMHGLSTLGHTLDNVEWVRDPARQTEFSLGDLAEFLGGQFAFFGPVLFAAYLLLLPAAWRRGDALSRVLVLLSFPILALVSAQAFMSGAYANWAATAYVGATLLIVPLLYRRAPRVLAFSLAVNIAISTALPVAGLMADTLRIGGGGGLLLERYVGRDEMARRVFAAARGQGVRAILATNRDVLADLTYRALGTGLVVYSTPPEGPPQNHYAQRAALPESFTGDLLFVAEKGLPEGCTGRAAGRLSPEDGAYRKRPMTLWRAPAACWNAPPPDRPIQPR